MLSQAVCLVNVAGQAASWYYAFTHCKCVSYENCQSRVNKQRLLDLIIVVARLSSDVVMIIYDPKESSVF